MTDTAKFMLNIYDSLGKLQNKCIDKIIEEFYTSSIEDTLYNHGISLEGKYDNIVRIKYLVDLLESGEIRGPHYETFLNSLLFDEVKDVCN